MLAQMVSNRLLIFLIPSKRDCEVNIFTEKFKMKKQLDSVLYCVLLWFIQRSLCVGFNEACWY